MPPSPPYTLRCARLVPNGIDLKRTSVATSSSATTLERRQAGLRAGGADALASVSLVEPDTATRLCCAYHASSPPVEVAHMFHERPCVPPSRSNKHRPQQDGWGRSSHSVPAGLRLNDAEPGGAVRAVRMKVPEAGNLEAGKRHPRSIGGGLACKAKSCSACRRSRSTSEPARVPSPLMPPFHHDGPLNEVLGRRFERIPSKDTAQHPLALGRGLHHNSCKDAQQGRCT